MSTAAEKAAARRKAILSRGSDRLSKLTSSARGDDPAYMHDDPPLPKVGGRIDNFLGEQTPTSGTPSPSPSPIPRERNVSSQAAPLPWSEEQQRQIIQALMATPTPPNAGTPLGGTDPLDPFAGLMSQFANQSGAGPMPGMPPMAAVAPEPPRPKTTLQKILPLIHIIATWCLLAYMVLVREPEAFDAQTRGAVIESSNWKRWAELARHNASESGWSVQAIPFFWTFMGLQVVLHSFRIFTRADAVPPPGWLVMATSVLPPPIPSLIINTMKYLRTGGMLLDDLAAVVVGMGVLILVAGWLAT